MLSGKQDLLILRVAQMGRKHHQKNKGSFWGFIKSRKLEWWLALSSVLLTSLSVYLLWQANIISQNANELNSENLVVSQAYQYGGSVLTSETPVAVNENATVYSANTKYMYCSHLIRLSNNGGAATSILNFSVRATYQNEVVYLEGYGEAVAFPKGENPFQLLPFEKIQSVLISKEMLKTHPLDESWINNYDSGISFPLSLNAHTSTDFIAHTIVTLNKEDHRPIMAIGPIGPVLGTPPPHENKGFYPLLITYTFDTSTGKRASTLSMECWNVAVWPAGTELNIQTSP